MIPDLLAASFLISRVYFWISGFFSNLWTLWLCTFEPSKIKANTVRTDRYRSHHLSSLGETKMNVWRMKSLRLHLGSPTNLFSGSYLNVKSQTCQRLFRSRVLSFEYLHDKNENLFKVGVLALDLHQGWRVSAACRPPAVWSWWSGRWDELWPQWLRPPGSPASRWDLWPAAEGLKTQQSFREGGELLLQVRR